MTWYTIKEKEPPKNTPILLVCRMREKWYGRDVYKETVGKYCSGLEWWDIPWTQAEPVLWAPVDFHTAYEKLKTMGHREEREKREL